MQIHRGNVQIFRGEGGRGLVKAWTDGVQFEEQARAQVEATAALPFVFKHVAVMPDVHAGRGSTVGSVIPTRGAIVPAAVGVDIGCGMIAARTPLTSHHLPENLSNMRALIEAAVPHGRTAAGAVGDRGAWADPPEHILDAFADKLALDFAALVDKHPKIGQSNSVKHFGTLGTGNHFIEVCLDEEDRVWVMLHSGSRGVGNRIGSYFIEKAKREMERFFIRLPDTDLAYLVEGTDVFEDYVFALGWAQKFAAESRMLMLAATMFAMQEALGIGFGTTEQAVNCHHNYVARENHFGQNVWVTRKGAVRAREGDLGIIPGSMGAKSFIVRGKGNKDSFHSCSHGAGRVMSRAEANRRFNAASLAEATAGVECRKDDDVVDEHPKAYKDVDDVMAAQSDLVEVVHTLKQVLCVKG